MGGKLRRFVQASCLVLFWLLLGTAETGSFFGLPSDLFLRLDPLVGTAIPLVTRTVIPPLFPAVFTILLAVLAGRIFCGTQPAVQIVNAVNIYLYRRGLCQKGCAAQHDYKK